MGDTTNGGLAAFLTLNVPNLAMADSVIANTSKQAWTSTATAATINYLNMGTDGHYGSSVALPGTPNANTPVQNIVVQATSIVSIPTTGAWTFGVSSDDGFRLTLTNGTNTYTYQNDGTRTSPADLLTTFNIASAGNYTLTLVYFQSTTAGAEVELFASKGTYAWGATGSAFQLVGNSGGGGLTAMRAAVSISSLADAESLLTTAANRAWTNTQTVTTINFLSTGADGHFTTGNLPFPGNATNAMTAVGSYLENIVTETRTNVYIPTAGSWTFGVNSDDGFRLVLINGTDSFVLENDVIHTVPTDSLKTFNFPRAGMYSVRLLYFQKTSGGGLELYATQGAYTAWNQTSAWRLLGDTLNGGLFVSPYTTAFTATVYKSNIAVTNIATAESVIGNTAYQMWTTTQSASTINYLMSGAEGRYNTNNVFPGTGASATSSNFVVDVTSYVYFPSGGYWTFGINSDDGFKLTLTNGTNTFSAVYSAKETLAAFNIPAAGAYGLRLEYFQNTGRCGTGIVCRAGEPSQLQ